MKRIFCLCMVLAMLLVLFTLTGCKGKQGKEVEVELSSQTSIISEGDNGNVTEENTDTNSSTNQTSKTQATTSSDASSDTTVIIGEDVVIDMGEELF